MCEASFERKVFRILKPLEICDIFVSDYPIAMSNKIKVP